MKVKICEVPDEVSLYCWYEGQRGPQGAYIELDLEDSELCASANREPGSAKPAQVVHGLVLRWEVPVLSGSAVMGVMKGISALADRILADKSREWDGSRYVGVLGRDAQLAQAEIRDRLEGPWEASELVSIWEVGALDLDWDELLERHDVTSESSDYDLMIVEDAVLRLVKEMDASGSKAVVLAGVDRHLKNLRDALPVK